MGENSVAGAFADNGLVQLLGQRLKFIEPDLYSKIENTEKTFRRSLQGSVERYSSILSIRYDGIKNYIHTYMRSFYNLLWVCHTHR